MAYKTFVYHWNKLVFPNRGDHKFSVYNWGLLFTNKVVKIKT